MTVLIRTVAGAVLVWALLHLAFRRSDNVVRTWPIPEFYSVDAYFRRFARDMPREQWLIDHVELGRFHGKSAIIRNITDA